MKIDKAGAKGAVQEIDLTPDAPHAKKKKVAQKKASEFSTGRGRALRDFSKTTLSPPRIPESKKSGEYTVVKGDTLWAIARRHGVGLQELIAANPQIANPDLIYPGDQINLPGGSKSVSHGPGPRPGAPATSGPVDAPSHVEPTKPAKGGSVGLTAGELKAIMPNLSDEKARHYLPHLNAAMAEAHINTPARKAAFLAQLAHESGELRYMEEIASGAAYEGRRDLGNTQPGDGRRFKGRGPIQLTGRANYAAASRDLGIDLVSHPERAADPDVAFRIAGWYWSKRGLNGLADSGNFSEITRRINGGYNGAADRVRYWERAKRVL
jgi:spore coat assembly protein SafA